MTSFFVDFLDEKPLPEPKSLSSAAQTMLTVPDKPTEYFVSRPFALQLSLTLIFAVRSPFSAHVARSSVPCAPQILSSPS